MQIKSKIIQVFKNEKLILYFFFQEYETNEEIFEKLS